MEVIRRVGKKAQVTLPKKMAEKLSIKEGDKISVRLHGEDIIITPIIPVRKSNLITERDLQEALSQAEREFAEGSAKVYTDVGKMFKDAGWVNENQS